MVKENYHDLNINWLLFDEGEILLSSDNTAKRTSEVYRCTRRKQRVEQKNEFVKRK